MDSYGWHRQLFHGTVASTEFLLRKELLKLANYSFGLAILALAGCDGSGTGNASLAELLDDLEQLIEETEGAFDPTPGSELPSGTATYTGLALANEENPVTGDTDFVALGSSRVTADFADGSVTASASGFYEIDNPNDYDPDLSVSDALAAATGTAIEGSFSYEMTQPVPDVGLFSGTVTGSLSKTDGDLFIVGEDAVGYVSGDSGERFVIYADDGDDINLAIIADAD